ncbi:glycosyltransferase family 2 protein [Akkermansia muciniphila]|uniref:glycosyltransferase family 2 protein n=1 Tax=Akkermansia muciniphila TaxID=239935 RepID=UPI001650F88A|nr:glycosyltransferase [Akkermansia muciniphila]
MPSPLISVIVPIYNMESLLPRCLDSLAAQTLRDLEIICVDDGSTDGSGGIVRKYASGDSRFRLITQENSGRAEARNAGIRAAAAPYLGFADPDYYVEPDMYERLYRLAEESGADMVQCSYSPFLPAESGESRGMAEEKLLHIENTACDGVFTEKGEIFRLFLEDRITGVVWSKLFRRILPGCSAPWKSACLLPSPAEKTPFTFPGPSPAAAASPSPLKNSTTTGWAVPNPFLLATGKRKPGPQVITPYSRCSPGKNSGKGFWAATARPT